MKKRTFLKLPLTAVIGGALGCASDRASTHVCLIDDEDDAGRARANAWLEAVRDVCNRHNAKPIALPSQIDSEPKVFARLQSLRLSADRPVVFCAANVVVARAIKQWTEQQTRTQSPIIFACQENPMMAGFAQSMARPGANLTGFTYFSLARERKMLECLIEHFPNVRTIGYVVEGHVAADAALLVEVIREEANRLGIKTIGLPFQTLQTSVGTYAGVAAREKIDAWIVQELFDDSQAGYPVLREIVGLQKPVVSTYRTTISLGVFAAIEANIDQPYQIWARQLDLVLSGYPVGDIPIETPTNFVRSVNRNAAGKVGLRLSNRQLASFDLIY
jgi:putative tryptophan/tyrosine transport system substrate-binding protein